MPGVTRCILLNVLVMATSRHGIFSKSCCPHLWNRPISHQVYMDTGMTTNNFSFFASVFRLIQTIFFIPPCSVPIPLEMHFFSISSTFWHLRVLLCLLHLVLPSKILFIPFLNSSIIPFDKPKRSWFFFPFNSFIIYLYWHRTQTYLVWYNVYHVIYGKMHIS